MTWKDIINEEKEKEYFKQLHSYIKLEYQHKTILPDYANIYNALKLTPLEGVKVVIIGQDPYPTIGVPNGLAFSVNPNIPIPKSLDNIFKEMVRDLGLNYPANGDLSKWATGGVLLLNRVLTVEAGQPLSHQGIGWEIFTKRLLLEVNKQKRKIVFILLGKEAAKIKQDLNNPLHHIIETSHPSPLAVYRGFDGSSIFSRTCKYLNVERDFWRLT